MLKLKLQYFGHLMLKADSLEKTLMLGKTEWQEENGVTEDGRLDSIPDSADLNLSKIRETVEGQGNLACCSSWGCRESDMT